MGVRDLWSVVEPVCKPVPLTELAGHTVAVDLSGWLVESENSAWAGQKAPGRSAAFLRTLVFRLAALLRQLTLPVCILDGVAPQLKLDELTRRAIASGRLPFHQINGSTCGGKRQRLRAHLARALPLLRSLGVPYLTAAGEAEAVCARLDAAGCVSGVLSDDSDSLLYGARCVYRRFSLSARGGDGGCLTMCCAQLVRDRLQLDVGQLRALAVLVGCDFLPDGVPGVGVRTAVEVVRRFASVEDNTRQDVARDDVGKRMLKVLRQRLQDTLDKSTGDTQSSGSHCRQCGHVGTGREHRSKGCLQCATQTGCRKASETAVDECTCLWHQRQKITRQFSAEIRCCERLQRIADVDAWFSRAERTLNEFSSADSDYPLQQGISAAIDNDTTTGNISVAAFQWKRPDVDLFCELTANILDWSRQQAEALVLPLLARWYVSELSKGSAVAVDPELEFIRIVRESRRDFVECYLIEWRWRNQSVFSTHEPRHLLRNAFSSQIDAFLLSKRKPAKGRTRKLAASVTSADQLKVVHRPITDYFSCRRETSSCVAVHSNDADLEEVTGAVSALSVRDDIDSTVSIESKRTNNGGVFQSTNAAKLTPSCLQRSSSTEDESCDDSDDSNDLSAVVESIVSVKVDDALIEISSDTDSVIYDDHKYGKSDHLQRNDDNDDEHQRNPDISRPHFSLDISSWLQDSQNSSTNILPNTHSKKEPVQMYNSDDDNDDDQKTLLDRLASRGIALSS